MKFLFMFLFLLFCMGYSFAASNTQFDPKHIRDFDKTKLNFNGQKVVGTIGALTTGNIDLTLEDDHIITGATVILVGSCVDDSIKVQVVSGVTVVNQFIDWYAKDLEKELNYPAKIPAGITLRVVYTNTCESTSVKVKINYSLHKVLL